MFQKIAVKIGTNVITRDDGSLNIERITHLVEQINFLKKQNKEVVIISSGAVAAGRQIICEPQRNEPVSRRQLWAALGQTRLMNVYAEKMSAYGLQCAQLLVTKNDFRDRQHYLNMKNCLQVLLDENIIPIINENDAISITELMFTDNDELAGLIAAMMDAEVLLILSNIDGIYNGDPNDPESEIIQEIDQKMSIADDYITSKVSHFGRGGVITKFNIAKKVASSGITVFIANGFKDNVLIDLVKKEQTVVKTKFLPGRKKSNVKKWIAHSEGFEKGVIYVNQGAAKALLSDKATSLLLIGITQIRGNFRKGDVVKIMDDNDRYIGLGRAEYGADEARKNIGKEHFKPLIHYDYLYLNGIN